MDWSRVEYCDAFISCYHAFIQLFDLFFNNLWECNALLALALYIINSPLSSLYDIPVFPENDIL